MRKLKRFTKTMSITLGVCLLLFAVTLYAVSSGLARAALQRLAENEASQAVQDGLRLLERYKGDSEALEKAVNPELNPSEVFLVLLDAEGNVLAAAERAESYLEQADIASLVAAVPRTNDTYMRAQNGLLIAAEHGDSGIAVAGKSLRASMRAAVGFRSLLLQYALLAAAVLAVALLLLTVRIVRPVDTLVNAAERLSEGETVEISEKLPVELRPLGRAFNQSSQRLARSMGELTRERDTLSQVLEGLDEGVLAVDRSGDVLRENQAAVRLLGGRNSKEYGDVLECLRGTPEREPMQIQMDERTLLVLFRPLADGALAVMRDVTEAERLERTRRDYVANVSHELRTPLSSMRGLTEALRDGLVEKEEERQRYYGMLLNEVLRLSRLVNDLLELSSLQANPAAFETEEVELMEILYELHGRMQPLTKKKGLNLVLDAEENLPTVITNEDRLQQILTVFLDNAVKFTPEGGTVTLAAAREGRYVRLSVRDTGAGMDAYTVRHAFDRFHQADPSHGAAGSGLGLAIAREIAQRLNLHILVHSEVGRGSDFSFLLRTPESVQSA
ncbi:MAG: HAMP domain-containing protein [Clostridia bacterium]|nr:HAMP domain-containing protein [Clostridia bacterium]